MKVFVKPMVIVSLVVMGLALASCNTSKGFGKDMEKAGEGLQRSAEKHGAD